MADAEAFLGASLSAAIRLGAERVLADELPDELELEPKPRLRFRRGRLVTQKTRAFEALGFQRFSELRAKAVQSVLLRVLSGPVSGVFAAIYDQNGAPFGISAILEDGARFGITTVPKGRDWPEPPTHETHWLSPVEPSEGFAVFLERLGGRPLRATPRSRFVAECKAAWVERVQFIKAQVPAPRPLSLRR
ncbi:MAG: hypothetical protein HYV07_17110 [Deltaproteobacteria bacterium]|nr:hypothetical protein [Deltaproteobacteria bacterium]